MTSIDYAIVVGFLAVMAGAGLSVRANWQGATAGFLSGGTVGILAYALVKPRYFDGYLHPATAALSSAVAATVWGWHSALAHQASAIRNIVPLISSGTALLVTPAVSLLAGGGSGGDRRIWAAFRVAGPDADGTADTFHVIPGTPAGRVGAALALIGFATFAFGVVSASWRSADAAGLAIGGMLVVFAGGLLRVYTE